MYHPGVGSVIRRIVSKSRHFHWLLKMNNRNLGTIIRGTDPTVSAMVP